jgi:hypothetical protein
MKFSVTHQIDGHTRSRSRTMDDLDHDLAVEGDES